MRHSTARSLHVHPLARRAIGATTWALIVGIGATGSVARADTVDRPDGGQRPEIEGRSATSVQEGVVSWYGADFHDRPTASGERFDADAMTMAHPSLPFGTRARVTNLRNGRSVVVRVNDRGPHVGRRIADLSQAAAAEIGMLKRGVARARIEVLNRRAEPVAALRD